MEQASIKLSLSLSLPDLVPKLIYYTGTYKLCFWYQYLTIPVMRPISLSKHICIIVINFLPNEAENVLISYFYMLFF